jgi:hypothetical protein
MTRRALSTSPPVVVVDRGPRIVHAPAFVRAAHRAAMTQDPARFALRFEREQAPLRLHDHLGQVRCHLVRPHPYRELQLGPTASDDFRGRMMTSLAARDQLRG